MGIAALIITNIGWIFQIYETLVKKTRNISIFLPLVYIIAPALFGIDSLWSGDILWACLDWVTSILALVVFIVLVTRKKAA
jgi:hypothetical protein